MDGYEIGYKSVEEINPKGSSTGLIKMQGYITEYQALGKENLYGRRFRKVLYSMNKRKKGGSIIICHDRECGACAVGVFRQVGPDRRNLRSE